MGKIINLNDIVKRREEREQREFQDKIERGISKMLDRLKKRREFEKKNKPLGKKLIILCWKGFFISLIILMILSIAALIKLLLVWLF